MTIEARVARLERSSRRWKSTAIALAAVVMLTFTMGQAARPSDEIDAKRITFRDERGTVRMELAYVKPQGNAPEAFTISFRSDKGLPLGELRATGGDLMLSMSKVDSDPAKPGVDLLTMSSNGLMVSQNALKSTALSAGRITVCDGFIEVQEGEFNGPRACLGETETVVKKTGAKVS